MYERLRLYTLRVMYMCTTTYVYMCTLHTMLIWFAVEVCIDFALVYRVFMFAADCATYGGVWGGQGGWLGRI